MIEALICIATAVYFEARGEPIEGQAAVAWVVHNRVESRRYPDNACDVVHEHDDRQCQFSYMCDGKREDIHDNVAYTRALVITMLTAGNIMDDPTGGATHYHATKVTPWWASDLQRTAKIDNHIFYKDE